MLILSCTQKYNLRFFPLLPATCKKIWFSSSSSSSSDDDEKKGQASNETAAQRLNRLLGTMQTTDHTSPVVFRSNSVGHSHRKRRDSLKQQQSITSTDIINAAKNISNMLGNGESERKQTESELLSKLLGHNNAKSIPASTTSSTENSFNLSELIVGMKIDRSRPKEHVTEETRSAYVRRTITSRSKSKQSQEQRLQKQIKREAEIFTGSVNLYGSEPLGIFKDITSLKDSEDMLATWSALAEHEMALHASHPPANYFEKQIQWTLQGKLWQFPINNEQNIGEEEHVDFSEHIFLEQHLDSWCPNKGPIRHFMELVCVGLSKNPYITAQEKKEHILWFRDYFEGKKEMLKDIMSKEHIDCVKSISASE